MGGIRELPLPRPGKGERMKPQPVNAKDFLHALALMELVPPSSRRRLLKKCPRFRQQLLRIGHLHQQSLRLFPTTTPNRFNLPGTERYIDHLLLLDKYSRLTQLTRPIIAIQGE
jgi:hypothetical protein